MTRWREPLLMQAPFKAYGTGTSGFQNPEVAFDSDGLVVLQGLADFTSTPAKGTVIAKLPDQDGGAGYVPIANPEKTLLFDCYTLGGTVRVDVSPDGLIKYVDGTINSWVSLSGISYVTGNVPEAIPSGGGVG